jgi:hypothetical protein
MCALVRNAKIVEVSRRIPRVRSSIRNERAVAAEIFNGKSVVVKEGREQNLLMARPAVTMGTKYKVERLC